MPPAVEILNWINTNWEGVENEWEEILRSSETPSQTLERHRSVELYHSSPQKVAAAEHLRRARKNIKVLVFRRKADKMQAKQRKRKAKEYRRREEALKRFNEALSAPSHEKPTGAEQEADPEGKKEKHKHDDIFGELSSRRLPAGVVSEYICPTSGENTVRELPQFKSLEKHMVGSESCLRYLISVQDYDLEEQDSCEINQ